MLKSYQRLTLEERYQIKALRSIKISQRQISKQLNRHVSTISRELSRYSSKQYDPRVADQSARLKRQSISQQPRKMKQDLITLIESGIEQYWSPEQTAGRLSLEGIKISHEAIYQHIWRNKRGGGTLYTYLRHGKKKYRKRSGVKAGRSLIPARVDIKARPAIVDDKSRIGDWEADTIIGASRQGAILSYVDRHSKYAILAKLERPNAESVLKATLKHFKQGKHKVHTITFDNGTEFVKHTIIAQKLRAKCFFATPYHAWERGLNEHTNGLVRQYLPKKTSFDNLTDLHLQIIQDLINNRPRKALNFKTPKEVYLSKLNQPPNVALYT
jgi:IS30 family transposase